MNVTLSEVKARFGTLQRPVCGKICRFKLLETVKVINIAGKFCCIERVKWKGKLPLLNQLCNVPLDALVIHEK